MNRDETQPGTTGSDAAALDTGAALEFRDVSAGYGSAAVLQHLSVKIRAGGVTALVGPNGAGKTTLLRTAAGIIRPSRGEIFARGSRVTALAPHRRAQLGVCLIPEGRGIFRSLTVRDNLRLQVGNARFNEGVVERVVSVFPALGSRMTDVAGRLSGGQQQMLALARAFVTSPQLILLDEVSMGLAPLIVDQIFAALRQLAETGVAMLLVEQYVTRALEMSDAVILLNKGTVSYDGPPSGLDEDALLRDYLGVTTEGSPGTSDQRSPVK